MATPKIFRKYSHFVFWEAFFKQNSVIRLESNILASPEILAPPHFWTGYATALRGILRGRGGEQNKGVKTLNQWIIELTSTAALMLSKQRNRLLIH